MVCQYVLLLATCYLLSATYATNLFAGYTIVGLFDTEEISSLFTKAVRNSTSGEPRIVTYLTSDITPIELHTELCSLNNILYIYVISSNAVIQYTTALAMVLNVPIFVFDTTNDTTQLASTESTQFYMNNHIRDEGNAFAKIAHAANWPHVVIAAHRDWVNDGLVQSFNSLFVDVLGLYSITVEYDDLQTSNDLLIAIQTVLTSRLEERQAHSTYNIIVLHMPPDVTTEVLTGANLLFHDRRIIWLISSISLPEKLPDGDPVVVSLESKSVDEIFIAGSTAKIIQKMKKLELADSTLPVQSAECERSELTSYPPWLASFLDVGLVAHYKLTYYQYTIHASSRSCDKDRCEINFISSAPNYNYAALAKSLKQRERQMYSLVATLDTPFTFTNEPQIFDGEPYCQTPALICLQIPESVIIAADHSSSVVRSVFTDFYRGITNENRSYTVYCCEGLGMDLLQTLSNELDFDYQLYLSPDGTFGAKDPTSGNWTGLVKELLDGRADMVAGAFSIISSRSAVVDYTAPYYYSGFSMLAVKRESTQTNYFSVSEPFIPAVWAMFMTMAIFAFISLSAFEWNSPFGMNSTHNREQESYTLASGIKTIFSLMSGNTLPCKHPKSWSGKWMQNVWGFFGIIYLSAYTANLTSSITDGTFILEVDGIYDPKLLDLKVAAIEKSAGETFVQTIEPELYENMVKLGVNSTTDGVEKLRNGDLDVYIHDTSVVDYLTSQDNYDCKLFKLGTFSVDSYGTAFPKGKHQNLKKAVSAKYLEYQESGYIEQLQKIYFPPTRACLALTDSEGIKLTVENAAGLFIILVGFIILCFCLIGVEHLIFHYFIPHAKRKPAGSWLKGPSLMFLSQRIHRAIIQDGAQNGATVFRNFANKLAKTTNVFMLNKRTGRGPSLVKLTFYDVVARAYEVKYKRPYECLYVKGWKGKPLVNSKTAGALREMAMLTAGMTGSVKSRRRYSDMLDEGVKQFRSQTQLNGHSSSMKERRHSNGHVFLSNDNQPEEEEGGNHHGSRLHLSLRSPSLRCDGRRRYSSLTCEVINECDVTLTETLGSTNKAFIQDSSSRLANNFLNTEAAGNVDSLVAESNVDQPEKFMVLEDPDTRPDNTYM